MIFQMKKILVAFFLVISCFSLLSLAQSILPVGQVKAGMTGKGKTVFKGIKIEEFDVEILGVLRNDPSNGPKKSMILAKLSGSDLEKTGVSQGMSGSPVYIKGKLIGAVAYGFPNSKEAIAGITPIEEMLSIEKSKAPQSFYSSSFPIRKYMSMEELLNIHKDVFLSFGVDYYEGRAFVPLRIPLVFNGFSSLAFEKSKPCFSRLGFSPVLGISQEQPQELIDLPNLSLKAGDPVGVQLITGDINLSATGTVTYVDGNKVLAFGHPLYNLGSVDYAMAKASVIAVVPSVTTSFKITATDSLVGRFVQDRSTGMLGELGKLPRLIPVNISLQNVDEEKQNFKVKIINDQILTPFLLNTTVSSIMLSEERSIGDLSLAMQGNIFLQDGTSIQLEDLFSGNFDSSVANMANLVTAVTFFLSNNEFKDLGIFRIDLDFQATEDIKISHLEKVWLDKYDVSPGEIIRVKVFTRGFRGEGVVQDGAIPAPNLPSGSEFYLVVADTQSLQQIERLQYRSQSFVPRSLDQLIRILSNQRKNNRIYFKVLAEKPGLFLKGEEMPNLPPSMKSMFSSPRVATSAPSELTQSTLVNYQLPVPFVFQGVAVIPVRIK